MNKIIFKEGSTTFNLEQKEAKQFLTEHLPQELTSLVESLMAS